jgi:3-oxoadipate enol-lactonase
MEYIKFGTGPLLIYLPGMEGTGKLFFRQEPELAHHFTVICLPLRDSSSCTYDDLIADTSEVYNRENADNATVVGESFGGTVALYFALKEPERVNHLVLANTFSYFRNRVDLALARLLLPLGFWKPGRWVRNFIMRQILTDEHVESEAIRKLLEASFSHGYQASRQRLKLIHDHDVRDRLGQLKMPVTILAGEKDRLLPSVKEARFLASRIANARLIVLPNLGHACFLSDRFSLAKLLTDDVILSDKS